MFLTRFAIKRPITTVMVFVLFGMLGVISWQRLPVQLVPNLTYPQLSVQVSMPGASPEKVEQELIIPVEGEIAKMKNVERISSVARNNSGSINVEFKLNVNMKFAALKLEQKVNQLSAKLPPGSRAFIGRNLDAGMITNVLMSLAIRGANDLEILRKIAEDKIKPELEKIDGIAAVSVDGGSLREVQVLVNESKARQYEINIVNIINKINDFNREKEFLGRIYHNNSMNFVTISGQVSHLYELENLIINPDIPLKLSDVAVIQYRNEKQTRIFRINGKQSVGLSLLKDSASNLLQTAEKVEKEIELLNKSLEPEGIELVINFNQAEMMRDAINQLEKLAAVGALLALLVLLFFLRNIKTVAVILFSIPISLLVTFNLMYFADLSINIISLIGLFIAIGMLVDNSIVVLENIFRHYELGAAPADASLKGCTEVVRSITASTATTIAVFIPILFLQDKFLVLFRELALAVVFPLLVSLFVAFTFIPMFAAQFLAREGKSSSDITKRQVLIRKWQKNRLMEVFSVILKSRLRKPLSTIIILLVLFLFSLVMSLPFLGSGGSVEEQQDLQIYVETSKDKGLRGTDLIVQEVELLADSIEDVDEVRSLIYEDNATVTLAFKEKEERINKDLKLIDVRNNLRRQTRLISGGTIYYEGEGYRRSGGAGGGGGFGGGGGGGGGNPLGMLFGSETERIVIKGFDQGDMKNIVEEISDRLDGLPETRWVRNNFQAGAPEMQLWADKEALDRHNIAFRSVMSLLWASREEGQESTTRMDSEEGEVLIRVRLVEDSEVSGDREDSEGRRRTIEEMKNLAIPVPGQGNIHLTTLTDVVIDEGPRRIVRVDQQRQLEVTYAFRSEFQSPQQTLDQARKKVDETVRNIQLPPGFTVDIIHEEDSFTIIWWVLGISALLIFMILAATFESLKFPWIIYATVPLAVIGFIWALIITGTGRVLFAMIALLFLLGIVVNNGIILIDYVSILRRKYSRNRALLYATRARVRPIMMTSITTILGVLPFAMRTGGANEIWPPFAIGLIGGLVFSALLTLVFIPVLYISIDDFISGMSKKGKKGLFAAVVLNAALIGYIIWWLESWLWMGVFSIFGLALLNGIIWTFYDYLDSRKRTIEFGDEITIDIRNLTKIYNEPRQFVKDWNKRKRREKNLKQHGKQLVQMKDIIESMVWKIPVFGFFMYLHTFFTNRFWISVLTVCTYFLARNILKAAGLALRIRKGEPARTEKQARLKRTKRVIQSAVVIGMFGYLHMRWNTNPFWPVFYCFLWFFLSYARSVTMKVYRGEVVIHRITGKFEKTRRRFYRLLINIPVVGRKKQEIRALHAVNLTIKNGMYGLLGPNGAGKTTLMRLISNIYYQSRGIVFFNQYRLSEYRDFIQKFIGYLPQKFGLYGNFTAWQYLNYLAVLNKFGNKQEREKLVESVIKNVNLWDRRHDKMKTYSGGMKQRIGIAQTLLNLPRIIVVDEPTSGLDPRERIRFRNMLSQMSKNRVVIFSTHIVEDISTSCREVAVLNKGKLIFQGDPERMRQLATGKVWESVVSETDFSKWNRELNIVSHIKYDGGTKIKFIGADPPADLESEPVEPTLEDAYLLMLNPV